MPPPPNRSLERGGQERLEKASEDGVISGAERGTGADAPERQARGVASRGARARSWRPGPPGRRAGPPRAEPGLLPAARLGACCFLLGIALVRSSPTSGAPAPSRRARGPAVSLASPGLLRLLPGGSQGVTRPLSPCPCNSSTGGRRPPSLRGRQDTGGCAGWFEVEVGSALFVCLFGFGFFVFVFSPLSFCFCFLEIFFFWFGFFCWFFFFFFLVTVETLDFFIKHPRAGSDGRDEGRTRARKDKEKKKNNTQTILGR